MKNDEIKKSVREIIVNSYSDSAKNACAFYNSVRDSEKNPYILKVGVNAIELTLRSILEKYRGYAEESDRSHILSYLCEKINETVRLPEFMVSLEFKNECMNIQQFFYTGAYYDERDPEDNCFYDSDFERVEKAFDWSQKILESFTKAQELQRKKIREEFDYYGE